MRNLENLTYSQLRRMGKALEVSCSNCAGRSEVPSERFMAVENVPLPKLLGDLKCPQCGSVNTPIRFPLYVRTVDAKFVRPYAITATSGDVRRRAG